MRRITIIVLQLSLLFGLTACVPGLTSPTITVSAMLEDTAGLFVGNDVGVLGVPIGRVTAIEPTGTQVRVTMEVDADQPLPAEVGAVVVARSVATDRYVELTPIYSAGPKLAAGAVIPQERTLTPVDFDDVLSSLNDLATGIVGSGPTANAVANAINAGAATFAGKGSTFNRAVTSLADVVEGFHGQRENFSDTLLSVDQLTSVIADNDATVREFIQQVTTASEMLVDERQNFRRALRSMSAAVEMVAEFASENRQAVIKSLDEATGLMESLLQEKAGVSELLSTMPMALQNLRAIYDDGWLRVILDPTLLLQITSIAGILCDFSPIPLCQQLHTVVQGIQDLVRGVLDPILGLGGRPTNSDGGR